MKDFDLLILRKRVFETWKRSLRGFTPSYVVLLLILRNRVFRIRKVEIWVAVMEVGRSADIHEFCFQAAKLSDMDCVELLGGLFADCQKWHFQAAKRSNNCSTILQEGRFADVHE